MWSMCKPQISQAPPETVWKLIGKSLDATVPDWRASRNIPKSNSVVFGGSTGQ